MSGSMAFELILIIKSHEMPHELSLIKKSIE